MLKNLKLVKANIYGYQMVFPNLVGYVMTESSPLLHALRLEKIGFVFLIGSGLKFLLFFLLLYPAFNADGELSSMEFASFFIPYTLTTVVENVVLVRQLSRTEP